MILRYNRIVRKLLTFSILLLTSFALVSCVDQEYEPDKPAIGPELSSLLKDSTKSAVVKFYAEWCSSCEEYAPAFEAVKNAMTGKADFYNIDIDDEKYKPLTKELKIARIPMTIFVSQDRHSLMKKLGPIEKESLITRITDLLTN